MKVNLTVIIFTRYFKTGFKVHQNSSCPNVFKITYIVGKKIFNFCEMDTFISGTFSISIPIVLYSNSGTTFSSLRAENKLFLPFEKQESSFSAAVMKNIQVRHGGGLQVSTGRAVNQFRPAIRHLILDM